MEISAGLVEIVLAFGLILGWAGWEVVRNRRELARLKGGQDGPEGKK